MAQEHQPFSPPIGDMQQWFAYLRRHNANIFDVFFKDIEDVTDTDVVSVIEEVAAFFGIPAPSLCEKCSTILEIMTADDAKECELYYNLQTMKKAGINNMDTLRLSLVHEISHQLLFNIRFMLFENELWVQELGADMFVGAFSVIGADVATGKFKYILRQLTASMSHPDGSLRAAVVEFGRDYSLKLKGNGQLKEAKDVLNGLPMFVYDHYTEMKDSWRKVNIEDFSEESFTEMKQEPVDYESLPDTNLLKQYYLENIKKKEDE